MAYYVVCMDCKKNRRNFLKGFFGTYLALSSYFSFKYFTQSKNSSKIINNTKEKALNVVQIPIVYNCNLNCAYCDHFAPIAPKYQVSVEKFSTDLDRLYKVTQGKVKTIWLLGGEPLLHNKICDLIKISSSKFKNSKIAITTNGLLLDKMNDEFWQVLKDKNVEVNVENYILNKNIIKTDKIFQKVKEFHCNLNINFPKYEFRKASLSKKPKYDKNKRFSACKCKQWPIFDDGKFYCCATINGVEKFFNKKFPDNKIPISSCDILDSYQINSIDEIIEFYQKPKNMCAHCGYFQTKPWKLSQNNIYEWFEKSGE